MRNKELIQEVNNKIQTRQMSVFSCKDYLPDTYLVDMKSIFNADPETDTISNVHWAMDYEVGNNDGVITFINGLSKEVVCNKLVDYAKEKSIIELHLLYSDGNGNYAQMVYDSTGNEFYPGEDVVVEESWNVWDGFFNIYNNGWKISL